MNSPLISIILCVRNTENFMRDCIDSIISQSYKNFELICVEGGSTDNTLKILEEYKSKDSRIKIFAGYDKQPEGRGNKKWFGYSKAKGDIIGIVDSDNVLQKKTLFEEAVKTFSGKNNLVGVLAGLNHDKKDSLVVRFVSLFGGDPFLAYRSVDFIRNFQENVIEEDVNHQMIAMALDNVYLTGGNVFFYLKKDVDLVQGYDQDVILVKRLVAAGKKNLCIINNATKHFAAKSLFNLAKKMLMQKDRAFYEKSNDERFDYFPKSKKERRLFVKNLFFSFLVIPHFIYSIRLFSKTSDGVSFAYPFLAFSTLISYGINYIRNSIFR